MLWLFTGIVSMFIRWPADNITDFKEVEYELSKTYDLSSCPQSLSSIAYAFAVKETWNGNWLKQSNKNNLFGLRYGKSTTSKRPRFAAYNIKNYTPNGYNIYSNRKDSIYDMMNHFYLSWCKLTKTYVKSHLNWPNGWWWGVDAYYKTLQSQIKKFENFKFDYRFMIKPKNIQEFHAEITKLIKFGFSPKWDKEYTYKRGCSIIVDTRNMKYHVTWQ